jgi:hypothetical protein
VNRRVRCALKSLSTSAQSWFNSGTHVPNK